MASVPFIKRERKLVYVRDKRTWIIDVENIFLKTDVHLKGHQIETEGSSAAYTEGTSRAPLSRRTHKNTFIMESES